MSYFENHGHYVMCIVNLRTVTQNCLAFIPSQIWTTQPSKFESVVNTSCCSLLTNLALFYSAHTLKTHFNRHLCVQAACGCFRRETCVSTRSEKHCYGLYTWLDNCSNINCVCVCNCNRTRHQAIYFSHPYTLCSQCLPSICIKGLEDQLSTAP